MTNDAMDKSKIENLNPQEYTHLPHADQKFEDHEQTDVAIRPLVWTLVAIALLVAVSGVGLWGLFELFDHFAKASPGNQNLSQMEPTLRQVPEGYPELQGIPDGHSNSNSPAEDTQAMVARNRLILAGKEPMRAAMKPGMPIHKAMEQALSENVFKTTAAEKPAPEPGQPEPEKKEPSAAAERQN